MTPELRGVVDRPAIHPLVLGLVAQARLGRERRGRGEGAALARDGLDRSGLRALVLGFAHVVLLTSKGFGAPPWAASHSDSTASTCAPRGPLCKNARNSSSWLRSPSASTST